MSDSRLRWLENAEDCPDLELCPFCGGKALLHNGTGDDGSPECFVFCCSSACAVTQIFGTAEDAIEAWNRRDQFTYGGVDYLRWRANGALWLAEKLSAQVESALKAVESDASADMYAAPFLLGIIEAATSFGAVLLGEKHSRDAYDETMEAVSRVAFTGEVLGIEAGGGDSDVPI